MNNYPGITAGCGEVRHRRNSGPDPVRSQKRAAAASRAASSRPRSFRSSSRKRRATRSSTPMSICGRTPRWKHWRNSLRLQEGRYGDRRQRLGHQHARRGPSWWPPKWADKKASTAGIVAYASAALDPHIHGDGPTSPKKIWPSRDDAGSDGYHRVERGLRGPVWRRGRELGLDMSKTNLYGGAIALGHHRRVGRPHPHHPHLLLSRRWYLRPGDRASVAAKAQRPSSDLKQSGKTGEDVKTALKKH